jgi:hypothetical protein
VGWQKADTLDSGGGSWQGCHKHQLGSDFSSVARVGVRAGLAIS